MTKPEENDYGTVYMSISDEKVVSFKVKVCQDAIVTLMQYPGIPAYNSYELVIGLNNQLTEVYDTPGGSRLATASSNSVLSCDSFRDFWISWEDKVLEVGSGPTPGLSRILHWDMTVKYYEVGSVAFSSVGKHNAHWELRDKTGESSQKTRDIRPMLF